MAADRAKSVGFRWNGTTYVFSAGRFSYYVNEDADKFQIETGEHHSVLNWLDLRITIYLGYLDQQLNAGRSYNGWSSAPSIGVVDVLNALQTEQVFYYPMLEDNAGNTYNDSYQVISDNNNLEIMAAARSGRYTRYIPVRLLCKMPLQEYPAWANR